MAKVIAKIDKKSGNVTFEVSGMPGVSCKSITDLLAMDLNIVKEEDTDEIYVSNEMYETVES